MRDLRWNCETGGCFRQLCPKLGAFDDCFPGRIGMSDIDGVVELGGSFLFLEWKSRAGAIPTGQRIMFQNLTALSPRITVIVVTGHPRDLIIETVQVFHGGIGGVVEACTLDTLKARIAQWAQRANIKRAA